MADLIQTINDIEQALNDCDLYCNDCNKGRGEYCYPINRGIAEKALELLKLQDSMNENGHWIGDSCGYSCSLCGFKMSYMAHSIDYVEFQKTNFCPHCGVRMDGVQE